MNDEKHYIENIIEDFIRKKIKYQELFHDKQLLFDKLDKIFDNLDILNNYIICICSFIIKIRI